METLNFEAEPFTPETVTDEWTALEEPSSAEKAQASANAARRAARESFDKFRTDCKGVNLLRRLTKDPSDSTSKSIRLRKKVEAVPELFGKIREETGKLNEALKSTRSAKDRDALREQHRKTILRLLDQAGFDPRVNWTEASALAHARCELSEFNWIQYGPCSGEEVEKPDRFAKAVAEHYVRTEAGLSLSGQTAKCERHSIFCDVRFPNGIVIRVHFGNFPDHFSAVQIAPRTGPKREYRYSCFRGQINLYPNQDAPSAGTWPTGTKFSPQAPSIPSGPYQVSKPTCELLQADLTELRAINGAFTASVEFLDQLLKQKPRNEPLFKETAERAKKQQTTLKAVFDKMILRARTGVYLRDGCSQKDMARVTCRIRALSGVWRRPRPIQPIKKLRDQLVFWLKRSRGAFANVSCDRLT